MNLRNFLQEVDNVAEKMTESQLKAFIHENARLLSEAMRADYLERLKSFLSENRPDESHAEKGNVNETRDFEQECVRLQEEICKIEEGDLYLEGAYSYDYHEWYDNDDDELILSDPHGIGDIIEEACWYVHQCVDCEEYACGYKLAEQLIGLKLYVFVEEWGSFDDSFTINDLKVHDLVNADYKQVVIDGLYLAYRANDLADRAEALYRMIENAHMQAITLEMVMQGAEELTDFSDFLPIWTAYLGGITGPYAQKLLKEAMELAGDPEILLRNAREFCEQHPALYEQYLDFVWNAKDSKEIFAVGNEALEKIDEKYVVRSSIAKRLGLLALEEQKKNEAEKYWLEAFRSETTVTNYMRIIAESADRTAFSEEISQICRSMDKRAETNISVYAQDGERKINHPGSDTVHMLAFFCGEFPYIKEKVMNVKSALGWSTTFMKCGLAAFLLLLLEDDELQEGGREMCRRIVSVVNFDKDEYQRWTNRRNDLSAEEWFWKCFKKWKENVEMSGAQKQKYLQWIERLIEKRVDGIMEANRRNYYEECASYIAALGEVVESRGKQSAKMRILFAYKERYSRRRTFHEALRQYGMLDTRKRR